MSKQELTDLILSGLKQHGPSFGVALLKSFMEGTAVAYAVTGDPASAALAREAAAMLEIVVAVTLRLEGEER